MKPRSVSTCMRSDLNAVIVEHPEGSASVFSSLAPPFHPIPCTTAVRERYSPSKLDDDLLRRHEECGPVLIGAAGAPRGEGHVAPGDEPGDSDRRRPGRRRRSSPASSASASAPRCCSSSCSSGCSPARTGLGIEFDNVRAAFLHRHDRARHHPVRFRLRDAVSTLRIAALAGAVARDGRRARHRGAGRASPRGSSSASPGWRACCSAPSSRRPTRRRSSSCSGSAASRSATACARRSRSNRAQRPDRDLPDHGAGRVVVARRRAAARADRPRRRLRACRSASAALLGLIGGIVIAQVVNRTDFESGALPDRGAGAGARHLRRRRHARRQRLPRRLCRRPGRRQCAHAARGGAAALPGRGRPGSARSPCS